MEDQIQDSPSTHQSIQPAPPPAFAGIPRLDLAILQQAQEESQEQEDYRTWRHRVSVAGMCEKRQVYHGTGTEPDPTSGRMALLLDDGKMHESSSIAWLQRAGLKPLALQLAVTVAVISVAHGRPAASYCDECKREIPYNEIHGHLDFLVADATGELIVVDHKSINSNGFRRLEEEISSDGYITQVCEYIFGLRKAGQNVSRGILLYKNKDTSALRQVAIHYDADEDIATVYAMWSGKIVYLRNVVSDEIAKHSRVEAHITAGTFPARPFDYDDWHCEYCPFQERCWDKYPEEIAARGTSEAIAEDDQLARALLDVREYRDQGKAAKATEDGARTIALSIMEQRKIKAGVIKRVDGTAVAFSLKGQKRNSVDHSRIPDAILLAATRTGVHDVLRVDPLKAGSKKTKKRTAPAAQSPLDILDDDY